METHFRSLEKTDTTLLKQVFQSTTNPMIIIDGGIGTATYTNKLEDKLKVLQEYKDGQVILLSWGGKYRTDVFEIFPEDIKRIL